MCYNYFNNSDKLVEGLTFNKWKFASTHVIHEN